MTPDDYPYASPPDAQSWQAQWPVARPPGEPPYAPPLALIFGGVLLILTAGNAMLCTIASDINPRQTGFLAALCCLLAICGSIGAQAALLTLLLTFGTSPLWQRLLWHWGLAAMALAAWCLGYVLVEWHWVASSNFREGEFLSVVCALPLIALASQSFLWFLRIYFRWRIEWLPGQAARANELPLAMPFLPPAADSSQRITIRDLLLGTVLVAVTMAVARLGQPKGVDDGVFWGVMLGISAASVGLSVIGVLPIVYLMLAVRSLLFAVLVVLGIWLLAASVAGIALLFVPGGPTGLEKSLIVTSLVGGFVVTLAGTLGLARWYGYRLVRT